MPRISTPGKVAATRGYGARVVFSGSTSVEREHVVMQVIEETGARLVPPYDHPDIVLGQGTLGLELQEDAAALIAAQTVRARDPLEHEAALGKHPAPVERAPRVARPPDPYDGPPAADDESDTSPLRGGRGPSFSPPHLLLLAPPDQRLERVLRGLVVNIGLS